MWDAPGARRVLPGQSGESCAWAHRSRVGSSRARAKELSSTRQRDHTASGALLVAPSCALPALRRSPGPSVGPTCPHTPRRTPPRRPPTVTVDVGRGSHDRRDRRGRSSRGSSLPEHLRGALDDAAERQRRCARTCTARTARRRERIPRSASRLRKATGPAPASAPAEGHHPSPPRVPHPVPGIYDGCWECAMGRTAWGELPMPSPGHPPNPARAHLRSSCSR